MIILLAIQLINYRIAASSRIQFNQISLFKGENIYLDDPNTIYSNSTLIHSTNPIEMVSNETMNIPYNLISITNTTTGPLLLYQINNEKYRIYHYSKMVEFDLQFNCSKISFFQSFIDPLVLIMGFQSKLDFIILNYDTFEIVDKGTFSDYFANPTYQLYDKLLFIGDNLNTINWRIFIYQLYDKLLFIGDNLNTINWRIFIYEFKNHQFQKLDILQQSPAFDFVIQFSLHQTVTYSLILVTNQKIYRIGHPYSMSDQVVLDQNYQPNCEYHKRSNGNIANYIQKCDNQYFGYYKFTGKINQFTQIVLINELVLYLNENELFFEDPILPSFTLETNSVFYYQKQNEQSNTFYYCSQNRLYEYKVNKYFKYLHQTTDNQIEEVLENGKEIQFFQKQNLPIRVNYLNNTKSYAKLQMDTIQFSGMVKEIQDFDDINIEADFKYLGIEITTNSTDIQIIPYQSQCVPSNVDFSYLIKFVDTHLRPDYYFEGTQFGILWLVSMNNSIQFATCFNNSTINYFPFINEFNHFYENESCLIADIFTFRVDNFLYVFQYTERIFLNTHIIKYPIDQVRNYQNCAFQTSQNVSYVSYEVSQRNLLELSNLLKEETVSKQQFFFDILTNTTLDKLLNKAIKQPVLHIVSIIQYQYEKIIIFYENQIENYLFIQGQMLYCYTFSFKRYVLNLPQYKSLQLQNPLKYSIANEKIAVKVNGPDQQYIFVFNFNSTFLGCLEKVVQSNSNIFILSYQYLSIFDQNQINNYYQNYFRFKFNLKDYFQNIQTTLNFTFTLSHLMDNYQVERYLVIVFVFEQTNIQKISQNNILKQKRDKIKFQIEDLFKGPIFETKTKEDIDLESPLDTIQSIKLDQCDDLSYNKSILLLQNNSIFSVTNWVEKNMKPQTNLILSLDLNKQCSQIKQFGNKLVTVCNQDSNKLLSLYENFIFQSQIEFYCPYYFNTEKNIDYIDDQIILCVKRTSASLNEIANQCQIFKVVENNKIMFYRITNKQVIYYKKKLIEYNIETYMLSLTIGTQEQQFNLQELMEASGFNYKFHIRQLYQWDDQIYLIARLQWPYMFIVKILNNKLHLLYLLKLNNHIYQPNVILLIENKFCVLSSQYRNQVILTYYSLNQRNSNYYFSNQVLELKQSCNKYEIMKSNSDYYLICLGYSNEKTSFQNSLQIVKISDSFQIVLTKNFNQINFTLYAINPNDSQEQIIYIKKELEIPTIVIILSFLLILHLRIVRQNNFKKQLNYLKNDEI